MHLFTNRIKAPLLAHIQKFTLTLQKHRRTTARSHSRRPNQINFTDRMCRGDFTRGSTVSRTSLRFVSSARTCRSGDDLKVLWHKVGSAGAEEGERRGNKGQRCQIFRLECCAARCEGLLRLKCRTIPRWRSASSDRGGD